MDSNDFIHVTGRFVSGNAFEKQADKVDSKTGQVDEGKFFVGVAVPKNDAQGSAAKQQIEAIAQQAWPNGEWQYLSFSMKIKDGDGVPQNKKEGYPGCWIFCFSQKWPFKVCSTGGAEILTDPKSVKRGDYVRVPFKSRGNSANVAQNQTPGVYLNAELVEFVGYGKAIISGVDPATVMAQIGQAMVPAGASAVPIIDTALPVGGAQPNPAMQQPPPPNPAMQQPPPQGAVNPHPGFLDPNAAPSPAGAPNVPAAPTEPVMTAAAGGVPYSDFVAKGWSDDALRQHGYII